MRRQYTTLAIIAFVTVPAVSSALISTKSSPRPETVAAISLPPSRKVVTVPARRQINVATKRAKIAPPINEARRRVAKKPFGIEIHPDSSPVINDRFNGYHVGVDFETFGDEQETDVPIFAICEGPLLFKKQATGYGGVAVQGCAIDDRDVVVIYGHLDLTSIDAEPDQQLTPGQKIGVLGRGYSPETDGVRKHLHLGIHEGPSTDIRGYVQDPAEMTQWLDALDYLAPEE